MQTNFFFEISSTLLLEHLHREALPLIALKRRHLQPHCNDHPSVACLGHQNASFSRQFLGESFADLTMNPMNPRIHRRMFLRLFFANLRT
jgi:hypothetical protein